MLIFKNLGEMASLEYLYKYDMYFAIFQLTFIALLGYIILSWLFRMWKQYKQLKNDKASAELALLKSKIDPHFFFNTLNNLYGLAIKKSDEAPQVILKLSEIMRYTIYEGENETVLLKDEINYLEQYIEVHKIRYKKTVNITFTKVIEEENISVAPLLFIMLLENAFKHGVESLTNNAYINLELIVKKKTLIFSVENNFEVKENAQTGIGIENLKRRLQLIYPKKHELLIHKDTSVYKTQLTIQLK
ncbi:sensor histidine kinase [Winogradskyella immobilis]|uniref:Histidine kinase n=1 Tax=Winogradskyella immobilis TaxID=2816852 RepID=A0ABS8EJZ8_9FLAO|nr:histidine kinase [Winogradskyella immobilis]MCC1483529.1 histidine kinase [Winogradskyella immobilis]MCG0015623.1 histidine kinase [Winogradskyella immobilis]